MKKYKKHQSGAVLLWVGLMIIISLFVIPKPKADDCEGGLWISGSGVGAIISGAGQSVGSTYDPFDCTVKQGTNRPVLKAACDYIYIDADASGLDGPYDGICDRYIQGSISCDCGETGFEADRTENIFYTNNCSVLSHVHFYIHAKEDAEIKKGKITVNASVSVNRNGALMTRTAKFVIEVDPGGGCSGKCSGPGGSGPGGLGSGGFENDSVNFSMNLGSANSYESAGFLQLYAATSSWDLAKIGTLQLPFSRPNVDVITNSNGIRQIIVPQGLVDIVYSNDFQYGINCYYATNITFPDTSGIFGFIGTPYATYIIKNPDAGSASNRLWITEQRGGGERQFQYTYTVASNRWDLLKPDGQILSTWLTVNATNSYITNYFRQTSLSGQIVSKSLKIEQYVPWLNGNVIRQTVDGDGLLTQTNTYTYYADSSPSSNLLQRVDYWDGKWKYYIYDESRRKTNEFSTYLNYPAPAAGVEPDPLVDYCRKTDYVYNDGSTRTPYQTTVSVPIQNGATWELQEISRFYQNRASDGSYEKVQQCISPGAVDGDFWNLTTTTYRNVTTDYLNHKVYEIDNADYTSTYYYYPDEYATIQDNPDGTQLTSIVDDWGNLLSRTNIDTATGVVLSRELYNYKDNSGNYLDQLRRSYSVTDLAGRTIRYSYSCCGLDSMVDADGVTTLYDYDVLKRQVAATIYRGGGNGIRATNSLDALGHVLMTQRIGTNNTAVIMSRSGYDVLGRLVFQTNALGGGTIITEVVIGNQRYVTNTYPDGGTRIEKYYRDGQLQSVTGTAAHPVRYEYGAEMVGDYYCRYRKEIKLNVAGTDTSEWAKTYFDGVGREFKTVYAAGSTPLPSQQSYYDYVGRLSKVQDPDGLVTLYQYDWNTGALEYTATDVNPTDTTMSYGDYNIDYAVDRIQRVERTVIPAGDGKPDRVRTAMYVWTDGESDLSGTLTSSTEISTDDLNAWQIRYGDNDVAVTNQSQTSFSGSSRSAINIAQDDSYSINTYSHGLLTASSVYDSTAAPLGGTTYAYDAHGRLYQVIDARNGTTTYGYNAADQINSITTPIPGTGQSAQVTTTLYDSSMRPFSVTQPDGTTVNTVYQLTGELGLQYGSRTYPVAYSYDYAGRMQTMTNWSSFSGMTGARSTTWNYDSQRGFLASKAYDDGNGPSYTYTPGGRLASRGWVRLVGGQPLVTTYNYDTVGSLTNILYSDATPAVTNSYDRLGRLSSVTCDGTTETLTYNLANELLTDSFSGGTLAGLSITNGYDALLRRTNLTALGSGLLSRTAYGYDNASRLKTVDDGNDNTAAYAYLANSPQVSQITFKSNSVTQMTTTKQYDYLNRLTQIASTPNGSGAVPWNFNYTYNMANQRTKNTLVDGSYWIYQYDTLGQVTGGTKYFADGTLVPGQQFGYQFDDIGNRKQTTAGGDSTGANLRLVNYSVNDLNQITSRDYPGTNDVLGVALATNAVTVNGQTAWRKGEYYWSTVKSNNTTAAQWEGVSVVSGSFSNNGNLFVPKTPEQFRYDADGNLTNDGRWAYTWDAENRLIQMMVNTNVGPQYQLIFAYDSKSRRIQKMVATNGISISTNKFLYDGWNLVAEVGSSGTLVRSYVWGSDLSGSMQGAGGVGGLLEVSYYGAATTNCFPAFDGNGNVAALINAADGTVAANYEYATFGEPVRVTGVMARINPFRFSTKYADDESDLLYYGYRYYKPSTGTWPSRDPLGEVGFRLSTTGNQAFTNKRSKMSIDRQNWILNGLSERNLYGFVANDSLDNCDADGRSTWVPYPYPGHNVDDPPSPPPPSHFSLCTRAVNIPQLCGCGWHSYLQAMQYPTPPSQGPPTISGWGFHGSQGTGPDNGADQKNCSSCHRTSDPLQNGEAAKAGKTGQNATDDEIWACITSTPPSQPYSAVGYNCSSWAHEAAGKCGLSCK